MNAPTMRLYSHTQLQTFKNCPLKYKFKYLDKIKKDEQSIEAFVGGLVHKVLRKLYEDLALNKVNSLQELLVHYQTVWNDGWKPTIKIVRRGSSSADYLAYGQRCIRNYCESNRPFQQAVTLGTEVRVVFPLDTTGNYNIEGYIDRLALRADGTYEIHDYKTSRHLPKPRDIRKDHQLPLYEIGLTSQLPDARSVELIWHYVGFGSELRSNPGARELELVRNQAIREIRGIEDEKAFRPRKSPLCDWCEYRPDCPLWKRAKPQRGRWEAAGARRFLPRNPIRAAFVLAVVVWLLISALISLFHTRC